jgi:hypothetical protein
MRKVFRALFFIVLLTCTSNVLAHHKVTLNDLSETLWRGGSLLAGEATVFWEYKFHKIDEEGKLIVEAIHSAGESRYYKSRVSLEMDMDHKVWIVLKDVWYGEVRKFYIDSKTKHLCNKDEYGLRCLKKVNDNDITLFKYE